MPNARTLSLKRETLTALSDGDLAAVNGGSHLCATDALTHGASCEQSCPTVPVNDCINRFTSAIDLSNLNC